MAIGNHIISHLYFLCFILKASRVWEFFFRIGGPQSEQVGINDIPEEAIAYN